MLALEVVPEDEAALLAGVSVQIDVELQVAEPVLRDYGLLDLVDGGLLVGARVQVEPVEIVVVCVQAVVPAGHAVRIDQRYNLDDVVLENDTGLLTFRQDEVHYPIENM